MRQLLGKEAGQVGGTHPCQQLRSFGLEVESCLDHPKQLKKFFRSTSFVASLLRPLANQVRTGS